MQILDHSSSRLSRIPKKNIYIKLLKKSGEISRTRNALIQSYSRCNSGRLFDFTSGEILTRNIRGISTQSSLEFRFGPEGIREVRIPGTLGRNFFFLFLFSFFFSYGLTRSPSFYHSAADISVMESRGGRGRAWKVKIASEGHYCIVDVPYRPRQS